MFLKSLTMKGFKSFADATTVDLEPGITVVVGPNGSGKSNIVDAVAWVLGAQGPRTVRSARMDDVIFAGSAGRPALGRAEVSLTIDNASGRLPIGFTEVTVTRTLFRSGESEYALNGAPCRLLDVQELLSDAGVGRQQHVIVSQGQLAGVLDARPEDRRLVVEEAAGVLKFRRRRERAQRRLDATEANLVRLGDLVGEVRRQLRPLERQAEAARRHGAVAAELSALRAHLAGRALGAAEAELAGAVAAREARGADAAEAGRRLAAGDAEVAAAEAAAAPAGLEDLGADLGRLEGLRERARGLAALAAERGRSLEREARASVDEAVVASLEADAARLAEELADAEAGAAGLAPEAAELGRAEAALAAERAAVATGRAAAAEAAAGRADRLRGELAAAARLVEATRGALAELAARAETLAGGAGQAEDRARAAAASASESAAAASAAAAELAAAADRRGGADGVLASAAAELAEADAALARWRARAEALALALAQSQGRGPGPGDDAGAVAGALGALAELVDVDPGWELAFAAAAGEALDALVVSGAADARAALARIREGSDGTGGAVLALGVAPPPASLALDAAAAAGGEPVRGHVQAAGHPGVGELLDGLLAHAVAVEAWPAALDLALVAPGLVVVTMAGDRFAGNWWRAGAPAAVAARAALAEAEAEAAAAAAASAAANQARDGAAADRSRALAEEAGRRQAHAEAQAALARAAERQRAVEAAAAAAAAAAASAAAQRDEAAGRLAQAESQAGELAARLPAAEGAAAAAAAAAAAVARTRARLDERGAALAALRGDLAVRLAGLEERRELVARRLAEVDGRLRGHAEARRRAGEARVALAGRARAAARLEAAAVGLQGRLEPALAEARAAWDARQAERRAAVERLDAARRGRAGTAAEAAAALDRARQAELAAAEARLRVEAAAEAARREVGDDLAAARDAPRPEVPGGATAAQRAAELERQLRAMGPVNPLAVEEHAALAERQRFVEGQLEDVRASRRELAKVIAAVDAELVAAFSAAYTDVADAFASIFAALFPGGSGRLRLTDPDDLLATGIEVEARPAGKQVRSLSLLSGGERSLAALAFLFAVFRSRPSPFYLLDEVEAALDDVNLHRFLGLLDEFRRDAQLLVVTHQKRTMEVADCLYGVTMAPGGPSRVLSERVRAPA